MLFKCTYCVSTLYGRYLSWKKYHITTNTDLFHSTFTGWQDSARVRGIQRLKSHYRPSWHGCLLCCSRRERWPLTQGQTNGCRQYIYVGMCSCVTGHNFLFGGEAKGAKSLLRWGTHWSFHIFVALVLGLKKEEIHFHSTVANWESQKWKVRIWKSSSGFKAFSSFISTESYFGALNIFKGTMHIVLSAFKQMI